MPDPDPDNAVDQPEEENLKGLSPADRRAKLAELILDPKLTQVQIAAMFGVSPATITADKHNPEFQRNRNQSMGTLALDQLGYKLRGGDMRAVELVVSRLELLRPEPDEGAQPEETAAGILTRLFAADPEKDSLRAQVADLELTVGELRERLDKLNGGPKDEPDDLRS